MSTGKVIEPVTTEWAGLIVLAPKKDGSLRLRVHYRNINAVNLCDLYNLPRMNIEIDSTGEKTVLSTLEAKLRCW